MAEIKLVFAAKVPHRLRSRHNWRVSACSRATRVHGAPFTEVCANDRKPIFGFPAPARAATEREMRRDVGVVSGIPASAGMSGKSINSIVIGAGAPQRCQPK